ncbi:MAG TPA: N-6 DNA methylase [Pyrinomonadaceae bacterium]|nr:N-6 DNA methylase [Pyrinomonadaceae bacterium]
MRDTEIEAPTGIVNNHGRNFNPAGALSKPEGDDSQLASKRPPATQEREAVRASESVLAAEANRLNEILRECKIKDEFRPVCAAAFLLALWRGEVATAPTVVLKEVNANVARALLEAGRAELAQSLRVEEDNESLAARAWEIIAILERLHIRSFTREHDYLGQLYETFYRYTGANTIGQYFTPRHIISFMCRLVPLTPQTRVFDPACGTGGFLVGALGRMSERQDGGASAEMLRQAAGNLYGMESEASTAALCVVNMILRGGAGASIVRADCFARPDYPPVEIDCALLNPPFPHKKTDAPPTAFLDRALRSLRHGGMLAAVVPYSLLVRTQDWHARILRENSLLFVATLPPDLFSPYASFNTAVIVLRRGVAHERRRVFFCKIWNDGYKLKKNTRLPRAGAQLDQMLEAYARQTEMPELCAHAELTDASEEWSPEAFIANAPHTDESFVRGFEESIREQAAFYVRHGHRLLPPAKVDDRHAGTQPAPDVFAAAPRVSLAGITLAPFRVSDHFDAHLGGKDEIEDLEDGPVPFVSTSEFMNGVTAWRQARTLYEPPAITVATDGSTCSAFVQEFPFYAFYKVAILRPKKDFKIPTDALYFVAYLLRRERWRYLYARKFGKKRINQTLLYAPADAENRPDFQQMATLSRQTAAFTIIQSFRDAYRRALSNRDGDSAHANDDGV